MYTAQQETHFYEEGKKLLLTQEENGATILPLLRDVLNFADWKYYVQSEPVFSDFEYDSLFKKLIAIEEKNPSLITTDSPSQRVAKGLSDKFPSVAHLVPMLSLDNTYNAQDLQDWDRRCKEFAGSNAIEYCVEPKYDGASISLIYENGKLVRGATRGDGIMGEEITTNVKQIRSIPLSAKFEQEGVQQIEIRGEVVIRKDVFAAFNEQRIKDNLPPLANPRNAASGALRILDPEEVRKRKLSAVLYHISYFSPQENSAAPLQTKTEKGTHYHSLEWLHRQGFPTPVKEMQRFTQIEDVIRFCEDFETKRDLLPYEIDGLVIKVNSFEMQEKMGMTSHHPRWAVAYKFKARQATAKLLRVEFQVGRTGTITPVAKIEPTPIGGVTVTSISLFNEEVIREKDLKIGDTVLVERAGDVIPYIVKPLETLRNGTEQTIVFPTHCPDCGQALEKPQDEAIWRCINISCPSQVVERLIHFCSKDAMDIRGMGEANMKRFFELGIIKDIPSLYQIDWSRMKGLEGFGEKSINNLQAAIEKSKTQPLNRLLFGLGIRHVGETMAKTLTHAIQNIKELYEWNTEKLITLEDVGPKVATAIADFFSLPENRHLLDLLEENGVNLNNTHTKQQATDGNLTGKTFLFTGTLSHFKRSDAEALVEQKGGSIVSGVSSKLNYLVVGADAGSKLEKAKKLGTITILTEEEFQTMIE